MPESPAPSTAAPAPATTAAPIPDTRTELSTELQGAVARMYRRVRREVPQSEAMGDTQRSVLVWVVKQGPQTPGALSVRERVSAPGMNQIVNRLQEAGLVEREPDPTDGRKVLVRATEAGTALVLEGRRMKHAWLNERLDQLSDEERRTLHEAARILEEMAAS